MEFGYSPWNYRCLMNLSLEQVAALMEVPVERAKLYNKTYVIVGDTPQGTHVAVYNADGIYKLILVGDPNGPPHL